MIAAADAGKVVLYDALRKSFSDGNPLLPAGAFDLGLLGWWPYIVKDDVLSLATRGYLNFHPSYLPYNRGKNPNFWTLVEGTPFGVTLHWVDGTVDGGDIAFQRKIEKTWEDNGQTLYEAGVKEIISLFDENFSLIAAGDIPRLPQQEQTRVHYAKELGPASQIDLDKTTTARELLNLLRARTFAGFPACRFTDDGGTYEVRVEIRKADKAG